MIQTKIPRRNGVVATSHNGSLVEFEPGGGNPDGMNAWWQREIRKKVKLLVYSFSCAAAPQVCQYGNTMYTELKLCGYTMKTIPPKKLTSCHGATPVTTLSEKRRMKWPAT